MTFMLIKQSLKNNHMPQKIHSNGLPDTMIMMLLDRYA